MKILTVWILYIYALPVQADLLKKKNENKYLVFDSTDENKELLKKYKDAFNGINSDDCYYEKDYMKIKFNSDDDLPLNNHWNFI